MKKIVAAVAFNGSFIEKSDNFGDYPCKFWLNGAKFPIKVVQRFWNNGTSFTDERCAFFIL